MKFINQRLFHTVGLKTGDYTCGLLQEESGLFRSWNLEDTYHPQKIAGVTRIPAGLYPLGIRKELTDLTKKHRLKYNTPWFKANPNWFHIEILNIPNYSGVYFHSGVDDSHTLGCNLPCFAFDLSLADNQGSKSLLAVDLFYSIVYPELDSNKKVFLEVRDEQK